MASQKELDRVYMENAVNFSTLSKANRKQVGCVLVTPENVQIHAYNGTPEGWDNSCEYEEEVLVSEFGKGSWLEKTGNTVTKNEVIHSELNAILHAARQGVSVKGSTLYVSLSPCIKCSAMIAQAGIKRVVYKEEYRDLTGVDMLKQHGIIVEKINA